MRQELMAKEDREIRGMFGRIAYRYDLLNRTLSLARDVTWRRRLATRVAAVDPRTVLDVCTGTADVALSIDAPVVVGADFSLPMLRLARRKAEAAERRLPLVAANALALPLADGSLDVVTVAFGIRNFSDLELGLAELVRVVRPGGLLLVLEFSRPRGALAPVLRWWVRAAPPILGRVVSGDREAYSYLPASVRRFPDGDEMCRLLEGAGLQSVSARPLTGGVATLYEGVRAGAAFDSAEGGIP